MTAPASAGSRLDGWGGRFSCYTAALASWLARDSERWWRPLLAGGPQLAVTRQPSGAWRFDHSPRPWAPGLGLRVHFAADWSTARDGLEAALETGSAIVAGDVFHLPWQKGHRGWHAPHWVTVHRRHGILVVDDPLDFLTEAGPQAPYRGVLTLAELAELARSLPAGDEIFWLRERSAIGDGEFGAGAAYRWLAPSDGPTDGVTPSPAAASDRLVGPDALHALADDLQSAGADAPIFRQLDDFWQALRLRELAAAAAVRDPEFFAEGAAEHWEEVVTAWRDIPVLLQHARIRANAGLARAGERAAGALQALAPLEDRFPGSVPH